MKTKIFILTYNNPAHLNETLKGLFSTIGDAQFELFIINNHTNFSLDEAFSDRVTKVMHNIMRPDWSTGHMTRNWNQAIMHGFVDLDTPDCDLLIQLQDDVVFLDNWFPTLLDAHKKYTFVMDGLGDTLCSYLPEAIRKIGLWEERYSMGWAELDYQIKAVIFNGNKTCINTDHPVGNWNPLGKTLVERPKPNDIKAKDKKVGNKYHAYSRMLFIHRWGHHPEKYSLQWYHANRKHPLTKSYVLYPYFEDKVEDLEGKNYLLPVEHPANNEDTIILAKDVYR